MFCVSKVKILPHFFYVYIEVGTIQRTVLNISYILLIFRISQVWISLLSEAGKLNLIFIIYSLLCKFLSSFMKQVMIEILH